MKHIKTHGGARTGAGRKAMEGTTKVTFRVTESYLGLAIEHFGKKTLNSRVNSFIQKLALNATISK